MRDSISNPQSQCEIVKARGSNLLIKGTLKKRADKDGGAGIRESSSCTDRDSCIFETVSIRFRQP